MTNEKIEDIKNKILFLHQRKIKAHISINRQITQKDGSKKCQFFNGLILELTDAWFVIEDEYSKLITGDYPNIWFSDVVSVEPYIFPKEDK